MPAGADPMAQLRRVPREAGDGVEGDVVRRCTEASVERAGIAVVRDVLRIGDELRRSSPITHTTDAVPGRLRHERRSLDGVDEDAAPPVAALRGSAFGRLG
jgi:hypothetical protein